MLKRRARSRLRRKTTTNSSRNQTTKLKLKPLRTQNRQQSKKQSTAKLSGEKITKYLSTNFNPKTFSLSLMLYFLFFIFLDQFSPDVVKNIPIYQAYLPLHVFLFSANLALLTNLVGLENGFLSAFFIELVIFFKLQQFSISWQLVVSLIAVNLIIKLFLIMWRKLKLGRKLKTVKINSPKSPKSRKARKRRLKTG